jgi:glycosyltransferase involved in cell wall biosynthesis
VSVGLTVYNGERFLAETLDSLVAQTFEDFELIVCDNASTDRTAEIVRDYAARDVRIRYVRHERNIGASGNERRAFALASAPYFRWSAADDLFAPESIARCVEVLDREPGVVLAYPKARFIDEHSRVTHDCVDGLHLPAPRPGERFQQLLARIGYCNAQYGLMRADAMRRTRLVGDFLGSDTVFLAELTLYGAFHEIPDVLFFRRLHERALSGLVGAEKQAHYRPDHAQALHLPRWRHLWEHLRSVTRAPISASERGRLFWFLLRGAIWDRDRLSQEVAEATRQLLAGLRAPRSPR